MGANTSFDVVLSFAGEDREYAEALAYTLQPDGATIRPEKLI